MFFRKVLAIVAVMIGSFALAAPVRGGVSALDISVKSDNAAGDATFTIDFPHTPDFFTVDSKGRPADSFQIQISSDPRNDPMFLPTTVIRGDEIQFAHSLPIRDGSPPALSDPHSGGWGAVRGTVPFTVNGSALSFTAPFSLLNVPDGNFSYYAFTTASGVTQAQVESRSVPVPSAFKAGMMMLGIGIALALTRSIVGRRRMHRA